MGGGIQLYFSITSNSPLLGKMDTELSMPVISSYS